MSVDGEVVENQEVKAGEKTVKVAEHRIKQKNKDVFDEVIYQ